MADIIIDQSGVIRRCGSLPTPKGRVCSLPPFGSDPSTPIWQDDITKQIITDPSRAKSREIFGLEWILDQLNFGSCNGHAIASAGARVRFEHDSSFGVLLFSGSFPYAQMKREGQDNGSMIYDDIEVCEKYGFLPLSMGPANKINRRDYTPADYAEAAKHKGLQAYRLTSLAALQTALANRWPCVVAVHAGGSFSRLDSKGICGVDGGMGNHAVVVDDVLWDGTRFLYDMANSWGTSFGQDGRGYLTDAHFRQTMGPHEFICLPSFDELGAG